MNIYISKANEEYLRTQPSMSGLINLLLDELREKVATPTSFDKPSPQEVMDNMMLKDIPESWKPNVLETIEADSPEEARKIFRESSVNLKPQATFGAKKPLPKGKTK